MPPFKIEVNDLDKDSNKQSVKRSGRILLLIFALVISAVCAASLGYSSYIHYDRQLENEAELLKISAGQAAKGVESRLSKLEDVTVIMQTNQEYMSFDAADRTQDEYEITCMLAEMTDAVEVLSLIDNYCDFTLIYRNDDTAGNLSADSRELLCDDDGRVYPVLTSMLGNERRCWVTGVSGNYDKVFYISQANDHTLFLGGFYTDELRYILTPADRLAKSSLILLDGDGHKMMSMGDPFDGKLPDDIYGDSYALIGDGSVQAGTTLDNGWRIVMIKDMTETAELYKKLNLEISVVMVLVMAVLFVIYIVRPADEMVYGGTSIAPEVDMLTGVINAEEAENIMADRLETCVSGSTFMLAQVRITNLVEMEKKYGRSGYNGAIIKTYRGLVDFFETEDIDSKNIVGRTGDGEFLVLADYTQYDLFKANDNLKESLVQLSEALNSIFIAVEGDTHICVGAAVYPHNSTDYDTLFDMAEHALNEAVGDDEKSYAIYKKEKRRE